MVAAACRSQALLVFVLFATYTILLHAFILERRAVLVQSIRLQQTSSVSQDDVLQASVQVFDSVFSQDACEKLHCLAVEHEERGKDGSSVFLCNAQDLTPLEHALNSVLTELGDTNSICEYWNRNEYLHMDAHADIDEQELEENGSIRCPEYGHVLYLDVDPSIRGPTCVFSQFGGWRAHSENITVVTVPAVQGRVLRFPGSAMHAVPRPPTRWFQRRSEEEIKLLDDEQDNDAMWNDKDKQMMERSVILFNTWSEQGPRGVTEDYTKGAMPEGIELDDAGETNIEMQKAQRVKEWQEDYGRDCWELWCRPRPSWKDVCILENKSFADTAVRVSLMGKRMRRLFQQRHVHLAAPSDLRAALEEDSQPRCFQLVSKSSE